MNSSQITVTGSSSLKGCTASPAICHHDSRHADTGSDSGSTSGQRDLTVRNSHTACQRGGRRRSLTARLAKKSLPLALLTAGMLSLSGCQLPFAFNEPAAAHMIEARQQQLDRAFGSLLESLESLYAFNSTTFATFADSDGDALSDITWQSLRRALQHKGAMVCVSRDSCPASAVTINTFISAAGSGSGTLVELYNDDFSISAMVNAAGDLMGPAALRSSLPELYPGARKEATAAVAAAAAAAASPSTSVKSASLSASDSLTGRMARLQDDFYRYLAALNQNLQESSQGIVSLSDSEAAIWYESDLYEPQAPATPRTVTAQRSARPAATAAPASSARTAATAAAVAAAAGAADHADAAAAASADSASAQSPAPVSDGMDAQDSAAQKVRSLKFTMPLQSAMNGSEDQGAHSLADNDTLAFTRQALPAITLSGKLALSPLHSVPEQAALPPGGEGMTAPVETDAQSTALAAPAAAASNEACSPAAAPAVSAVMASAAAAAAEAAAPAHGASVLEGSELRSISFEHVPEDLRASLEAVEFMPDNSAASQTEQTSAVISAAPAASEISLQGASLLMRRSDSAHSTAAAALTAARAHGPASGLLDLSAAGLPGSAEPADVVRSPAAQSSLTPGESLLLRGRSDAAGAAAGAGVLADTTPVAG